MTEIPTGPSSAVIAWEPLEWTRYSGSSTKDLYGAKAVLLNLIEQATRSGRRIGKIELIERIWGDAHKSTRGKQFDELIRVTEADLSAMTGRHIDIGGDGSFALMTLEERPQAAAAIESVPELRQTLQALVDSIKISKRKVDLTNLQDFMPELGLLFHSILGRSSYFREHGLPLLDPNTERILDIKFQQFEELGKHPKNNSISQARADAAFTLAQVIISYKHSEKTKKNPSSFDKLLAYLSGLTANCHDFRGHVAQLTALLALKIPSLEAFLKLSAEQKTTVLEDIQLPVREKKSNPETEVDQVQEALAGQLQPAESISQSLFTSTSEPRPNNLRKMYIEELGGEALLTAVIQETLVDSSERFGQGLVSRAEMVGATRKEDQPHLSAVFERRYLKSIEGIKGISFSWLEVALAQAIRKLLPNLTRDGKGLSSQKLNILREYLTRETDILRAQGVI